MKSFLMILIIIISSFKSFGQDDYLIQINDTIFEISLEKEYKININGQPVKFNIKTKDTLLYDDDLYSFKYPKNYKVSKMTIEEGIEQIMIMTAEGSGILIQKYSSFNPTMLNEMMISEITKESISYGFEMERKDYTRNLNSGQKINIDKAVLTYKDDINIYEIASIGKKDEGIIIMTMKMDNNINNQGTKIINLMWDSLNYK